MFYSLQHFFFLIENRKLMLLNGNTLISKSEIHLIQALDKYGNIKSTKSNKKDYFRIPKELIIMLQDWKVQQRMSLQNLISFKQINNLYLRT